MPEADPRLSDAQRKALVSDGYDAVAETYTELAKGVPESHPRREQTAQLLGRLSPRSRVLELGCGGGLPVAAAIVASGHAYLGVDISPRQVELARTRVPAGEFIVGDVVDQDFETATFHAVLMLYAITHVPREQWSSLLSRIQRWLRPDGWFLLNVPHHASPGWLEEDFLGLGATNWTNSYDSGTALELLEAASFVVIDKRRLGEDDLDPEGWLWVVARPASGSW